MRKVLIPTKLDKFAATMLSDRGYNVVLDGATPLADLVKANSDAEVLIVRSEKITPEIIDLLPNLKLIVRAIVKSICDTNDALRVRFPQLTVSLSPDVTFITSQELEDMYPDNTPKEREYKICKLHGAVFISQIGGKLASGEKHDGRAPDYDDWSLNGDIIVYYQVLDIALELSSMGIRVDEKALEEQLKKAGCEERKNLPFQKEVLEGKLPYTIGGGIGQSRICMFFLRKAHIGEVQVSVWPEDMDSKCREHNIFLL